MRKRFIFCIGWDIFIVLMLYFYNTLAVWLKTYKIENFSTYPFVVAKPLLLILIGVAFGVLVFSGKDEKLTGKQAILEFVMIGIPAFYFTTILEMSYFIYFVLKWNITIYSPTNSWLYFNSVPSAVGGVIFGYELLALIIRLRRSTR